MVRGITKEFNDKKIDAKFFIEYLDTRRYPLDLVYPDLKHLYESKFKNIKFDLIFTTDNNALEFLRRCRKDLFTNIPVVFSGLDLTNDSLLDGLDPITGVVENMGEEFTVETALKFHPYVEKLIIVNNKHFNPIRNLNEFCNNLKKRKDLIFFEITDYEPEEFIKIMKSFDKNNIILMPTRFTDPNQKEYTSDMMSKILSLDAPIYTNDFPLIGSGPVGGCMNFASHHGQIAAEMGIKILNGQSAKNIPIMRESPKDYMFDYKQLKRFGYLFLNCRLKVK